jgi:hypothetical protein
MISRKAKQASHFVLAEGKFLPDRFQEFHFCLKYSGDVANLLFILKNATGLLHKGLLHFFLQRGKVQRKSFWGGKKCLALI